MLNQIFRILLNLLGLPVANGDIDQMIANGDVGDTLLSEFVFGGRVRYTIVDKTVAGCTLELTFIEHPSPLWRGGTISFVIDQHAPAKPQIAAAMQAGLRGEDSKWYCHGSLVGVLNREDLHSHAASNPFRID